MLVRHDRTGSNGPTVSYTRGLDLSGSLPDGPTGAGGIGGLLARTHGYSAGNWTTHACYHADGNGNITCLITNQTVVATYRYDPYGRPLGSSGSLAGASLYRFSSKPIHVNSGLYYYGYRFYSPELQRWMNRDSIGEGQAGMNLYRSLGNSPSDEMDAYGLFTAEEEECMTRAKEEYRKCRKMGSDIYNAGLNKLLDLKMACHLWCKERSLLFQPFCHSACTSAFTAGLTGLTSFVAGWNLGCLDALGVQMDACLDRSDCPGLYSLSNTPL